MSRPGAEASSRRRIDVLVAIASSIGAPGYPPTVREIGKMIGLRSTNGVQAHLDVLLATGLIHCDHMPRSMRMTPAGESGYTTARFSSPRCGMGSPTSTIRSISSYGTSSVVNNR
jgi:repressor LexA